MPYWPLLGKTHLTRTPGNCRSKLPNWNFSISWFVWASKWAANGKKINTICELKLKKKFLEITCPTLVKVNVGLLLNGTGNSDMRVYKWPCNLWKAGPLTTWRGGLKVSRASSNRLTGHLNEIPTAIDAESQTHLPDAHACRLIVSEVNLKCDTENFSKWVYLHVTARIAGIVVSDYILTFLDTVFDGFLRTHVYAVTDAIPRPKPLELYHQNAFQLVTVQRWDLRTFRK